MVVMYGALELDFEQLGAELKSSDLAALTGSQSN